MGRKGLWTTALTVLLVLGLAGTAAAASGEDLGDKLHAYAETEAAPPSSTSRNSRSLTFALPEDVGECTGLVALYQNGRMTMVLTPEISGDTASVALPGAEYHAADQVALYLYSEGTCCPAAPAAVYTKKAGGSTAVAYITSAVKSERVEGGYGYWEFDAILDGMEQRLTAKGRIEDRPASVIDNEAKAGGYRDFLAGESVRQPNGFDWNGCDGLVELCFDGSGEYVIAVKPIPEKDIYSYYGDKMAGGGTESPYRGNNSNTTADDDPFATFDTGDDRTKVETARVYRTGMIGEKNLAAAGKTTWYDGSTYHHHDSVPTEIRRAGRTLYVTGAQVDEGLALASSATAVVIQREDGVWRTRGFSSVDGALEQIMDCDGEAPGLQYNGEVIAALNGGFAEWVLFVSYGSL